MAQRQPQPEEAPDFGRYKLSRRVSVGGTAEVFKAKAFGDHGFEKVVALKRLLPHAEERPELVSSFVDEAKLAAQLDHPRIARIYELGRVRGSHYLTMEYVYGRDVQQLLRLIERHGLRADPLLVAALGAQVADALAYAHGFVDEGGVHLQVVHRDVSPQNLMIERSGLVKLVDFGIARFEGRDGSTATGVLKGKHGYMSPEQVRREAVDGRSDLFSLGVVLWEMLVGERLFRGESLIDSLALIEAAEVPQLSEVAPDVPAALSASVMCCLARSRDDRPHSAAALERGLRQALRDLGEGDPTAVVARGYAALFPDDAALEQEVTLDEYRQALRAIELGEDPGLVGRNASDITIVPDTADLRAYLEELRQHLPGPAARPEPSRAPGEADPSGDDRC